VTALGPVGALEAAAPAAASPSGEKERLKQAAKAFEALLMQTMLKSMRQAQLQDGLFGAGPGASVYEGLFDERMSEQMSEKSPLGIATMLEEQWTSRMDGDRLAREALQAVEAERGRRGYDAAAAAGMAAGAPLAGPSPKNQVPAGPGAEARPIRAR
jgi:flagellar protein FlgJ